MTSNSFKKFLFAGTAIIAVSAFSSEASATHVPVTAVLTGNTTWASTGLYDNTTTTGTTAYASDNANIGTYTLTVINNGTADDHGTKNLFTLGAVTGTTGTFKVDTGSANDVTVNLTSIALSGAGAINIGNATTPAQAVTMTIAGAVTNGGTFTIANSSAAGADIAMTVGGAYTNTGATTITAGAASAAASSLAIAGAATFTGGVTVTGGAGNAGAQGILTLTGTTETGAVTLTNGTLGQAILNLNSTSAQTISGAISGTGDINVQAGGTSSVTFASNVASGTTAIATTGTVDFAGTLATALSYSAAGTVDLAKTLTGSINFAGNNGTAVIATGANVTSTIDSTVSGAGTVTFSGSSEVTGAVGTTNAITTINAGATSKTVKFDGAVKAGTLHFTGNGDVEVVGALTGAVTTASNGYGNLLIDAASTGVTTVGAADKALASLGIGANVTATSVYANNLALNNHTLTLGSNYTLSSGQTFNTLATADDTAGNVNVTGNVALNSGSTVLLSMAPAYYNAGGFDTTYVIATATGTAASSATAVSNIPGYNVATSVVNKTVVATLTAKSASSWTEQETAQARIIQGDLASNSVLSDLNDAINTASTVAERNNLIKSVIPNVDGASQISVIDAAAQVQSVTDTRIASIRNNDALGISAGDKASNNKLWFQGYYNYADQGERSGIEGYNADTAGIVLGADTGDVADNLVLGAAFNYGTTKAISDNVNATETDINTFGGSVYASYNFPEAFFVDVQAGYAYNDLSINNKDCGGSGLYCKGDTSSNQYSGKLAVGRDFEGERGMIFTPSVYTSYVSVSTDSYTEKGNGATKHVDTADVSALDAGLSLDTHWEIQAREGIMKPSFNVGYAHDFVGDPTETTAYFTGVASAASFKTTGADAAKDKYNIGVGFAYETNADWDISAKYDAVIKDAYYSHNASMRFTTHF